MAIVIDASVAIAWCLRNEEGTPEADVAMNRTSFERVIVPGIFWDEIRNVLVVAERKGRTRQGDPERHLKRLRGLRFVTDNDQNDRQTIDLARRHGLSGYDAAYLETAKRRGVKLATLDGKLAKAAVNQGISIVGDG